jgi:hypothetical protein
MCELLAIDACVCARKARHHMRVYKNNKPHKWGYKCFMLCGDLGFAHKIVIYSGQENDPKFQKLEEPGMGASSNVVV